MTGRVKLPKVLIAPLGSKPQLVTPVVDLLLEREEEVIVIHTCASRPAPLHIACNILRRFIPSYIATYNTADTLYQACIVRLQRREGYIGQLATITAGDIDNTGIVQATQGITGQPWGTFEVYLDGTVQVELRNLDLETACELATLVFPR